MTKSAGLLRAYAVLERLELLRRQDVLDPLPPDAGRASHHCGGLALSEDETEFGEKYSHSHGSTRVENMSFHRSHVDGRSQALQRVLRGVLALREQAGRHAGAKRQPDDCNSQPQTREGAPISLYSPYGGCKPPFSKLLSPLRDGEEDNVFLEELPIPVVGRSCGTQKREKDRRGGGKKGGRVCCNGRETSGDRPAEAALDEEPHVIGRKRAGLVQCSTENNSQRRTRDSPTTEDGSDCTKSPFCQHRDPKGKLQDDDLEWKGHPKQQPDSDDQFLSYQETTTTPVAIFSTISHLDEPDEDSPFLPRRALDIDALNKDASGPPSASFFHKLTTMGSVELQEVLHNMEGCSDGTSARCQDWFVLTALVNTHDAIRHVIVPLLLSELLNQSDTEDDNASDANSRVSNILCALIGLGEPAASSLPTLLDMLARLRGCSRLVALAIRAVGGNEGIHALCRLARCVQMDSRVRAAAAYGLCVLAYPVLGHTTVYCIGAPGLSNTIVFYKPPVSAGYMEVDKKGDPRRESSLLRPPPYRPTHIVLCAETVREALLQFVASKNFRRAASSYAALPLVLQDFARDAPEACRRHGLPDDVLGSLYYQSRGLVDNTSFIPVRVLSFSYDPHFVGCEDELFAVEETLMVIVYDKETPLNVVEQTLVSIASLPDFATTHVLSPVLDFIIQYVAHFEQRQDGANDEKEAVLVAGLVALGRLARNENTSPSLTDTACAVLLHNLASARSRVRNAACVGLGEVGVVANRPMDIAAALVECLRDVAMNHDTVAWALTRLGVCGVRVVLDHIASGGKSGNGGGHGCRSGRSTVVVPLLTRVACVRSLAKVDLLTVSFGVYEHARRLRDELVRRFSAIIVSEQMEEDIAVECAYALGEVVGVDLENKAVMPRRNEEAATYYRSETPSEAFGLLRGLVESSSLPFAVQKALFHALCLHGGSHAELCVSQTAIQSPLATLRAAAVFGLRGCGGKIIRTLVIALNDENADVRHMAFDTLDAVGVDAVLAILRSRPWQHTQQVVAALRDCLLRDMGRNAKRQVAQNLYANLVRACVSLF